MIEIFVLIRFCRRLAAIAREKGRTGAWGALGANQRIGGENGGAMHGISSGAHDLSPYGYALVGAALGACLAYAIVRALDDVTVRGRLPNARLIT